MTTSSVSLRPDPSKQHPPIAQIPEGTALAASGKSPDGGWWLVSYTAQNTAQTGWVGAGAVFAASACAALPSVTVTPAP
jgi:uncharacterized protein YraI